MTPAFWANITSVTGWQNTKRLRHHRCSFDCSIPPMPRAAAKHRSRPFTAAKRWGTGDIAQSSSLATPCRWRQKQERRSGAQLGDSKPRTQSPALCCRHRSARLDAEQCCAASKRWSGHQRYPDHGRSMLKQDSARAAGSSQDHRRSDAHAYQAGSENPRRSGTSAIPAGCWMDTLVLKRT